MVLAVFVNFRQLLKSATVIIAIIPFTGAKYSKILQSNLSVGSPSKMQCRLSSC